MTPIHFQEAHLLRIYVNASERGRHRRVYQEIVETAHAEGMAGASVFPVVSSFGSHGQFHVATSDYEFADLPVIIELIDTPASVSALLDRIAPILRESLATVALTQVVRLPLAVKP